MSLGPPKPSSPPAALCWKQKPVLRTWPERFATLGGGGRDGNFGLIFFDPVAAAEVRHRAAAAGGPSAEGPDWSAAANARGSSVRDVRGCEVGLGEESWAMLGKSWPKVVLSRPDLPGGGVVQFCFATLELRDSFATALRNLVLGRPFDADPPPWEAADGLAAARASAAVPIAAALGAMAERALDRDWSGLRALVWGAGDGRVSGTSSGSDQFGSPPSGVSAPSAPSVSIGVSS